MHLSCQSPVSCRLKPIQSHPCLSILFIRYNSATYTLTSLFKTRKIIYTIQSHHCLVFLPNILIKKNLNCEFQVSLFLLFCSSGKPIVVRCKLVGILHA